MRRLILPLLLAASPATAQSFDCVIEPLMVLQVGAAAEGVVASIEMKRGAPVKKGDILATLESSVEQSTLKLAEAQVESTVGVELAESRLDLARKELARAQQLMERGAGTQATLDVAEAEVLLAELSLRQAEEARVLLQHERDRAQAILERRTVRSPVDGVLLRRLVGPGEYVFSQAQIAQIATIEPLYVDVFLPTELYDAISIGQVATVRPAEPISGTFDAEVTAIDQVFDAASDTFGVRLTMPNPDGMLPAGVDCTIEFGSG